MTHTIAILLALHLGQEIDTTVECFRAVDDIQGAEAPTTEPTRADRLAAFLCALQPRLRWHRGREWTQVICREAAEAYIRETSAAGMHDLLPLAVSIQESDLVDTALSPEGRDSGLMGVRDHSVWTKGLKPGELRKIPANIHAGVAELRDVMAGTYWQTFVAEYRLADGRQVTRATRRLCDHSSAKGHPVWTHYNNGPRVHPDKFKASYGARVATIYAALCRRLGDEPRELVHPWMAGDHRTVSLVKVIDELEWPDSQDADLVD